MFIPNENNQNNQSDSTRLRQMPLLTTSLSNAVQYMLYIGKDNCNILFKFNVT